MASASVYEGIGSILERINSIFGQFQQQIWRIYGCKGRKHHFRGCCVAVVLISRSDLVQVFVYGKCEYT